MGWGWAPRPVRTLPPGKLGTHCTEGWVGHRASLAGWKISSPPGSIPDRPDRSQSLYRLIYQVHVKIFKFLILRESRILYAKVTKLMQWKQLYKWLLRTDSRLKAAEHRKMWYDISYDVLLVTRLFDTYNTKFIRRPVCPLLSPSRLLDRLTFNLIF